MALQPGEDEEDHGQHDDEDRQGDRRHLGEDLIEEGIGVGGGLEEGEGPLERVDAGEAGDDGDGHRPEQAERPGEGAGGEQAGLHGRVRQAHVGPAHAVRGGGGDHPQAEGGGVEERLLRRGSGPEGAEGDEGAVAHRRRAGSGGGIGLRRREAGQRGLVLSVPLLQAGDGFGDLAIHSAQIAAKSFDRVNLGAAKGPCRMHRALSGGGEDVDGVLQLQH